jgi:transcription antitermination factor NusG
MMLNGAWYALYVRPHAERAVARHLEEKGHRSFVPVYRSRRHWSDRIKELDLPLFPSYVFLMTREHAIGRVVTIPGVIRVLGVGKSPVPVDSAEIDALQRLVAYGTDPRPWPFFRAGQPVEITAGPLRGVRGLIERVGNGTRLIVSISLLQRSVAVEIDACDVTLEFGRTILVTGDTGRLTRPTCETVT